VEGECRKRGAPDGSSVQSLSISSFSAGYGAVRQIIDDSAAFKLIKRVVLCDSMYGSLDSSSQERVPAIEHIVCWKPLADAAIRGEKTFCITFSRVPTPTYASSSECASALVRLCGGENKPVEKGTLTATLDAEFPLLSRFDKGHFHVWGYGGEDGQAHMTHARHLADVWKALDDPSRPLPHIAMLEHNGDDHALVPERPTELARKLAAGQFVVTVEVSPPRSFVPQKLLASAQLLQEAGADMVDVADSPTARMRMSPWAVCHFLQTRLNLETVLHFPTRGRNLLRVQGDLLAAHALGLRNLFVVMGDPTRIGDYPEAMDNYDVAPSALIGVVKNKLNHVIDLAGNSSGLPTTFTVGCALNMGADDIDHEIGTLRKKLANGADFAIGQVIFDPIVAVNFDHTFADKLYRGSLYQALNHLFFGNRVFQVNVITLVNSWPKSSLQIGNQLG
jgi:5,10-methylenetetrahydrofolate reductase